MHLCVSMRISMFACTCIVLYCIVSIHLYSASCSAHQSEALPVRETQREENSVNVCVHACMYVST